MTRSDYLDHLSRAREGDMATERDESRGVAHTAPAPDYVSPEFFTAVVKGILAHPELINAVAGAIAGRIGMIPTPKEIARELRTMYADDGVPQTADRPEGHPVNPADGLS